eukprot:6041182-Alexandrium_andersonii.AAC.1
MQHPAWGCSCFGLQPGQKVGQPLAMEVRDQFVKMGSPSTPLDEAGRRDCMRLAEIGKAFLLSRAKAFVRSASGRAVLYTYASDGTPMLSKSYHVQKVTESKKVRRVGGSLHELLVQRSFFKFRGLDGQEKVWCYFRDPVPLDKGKTAGCMYTAMVRFFPLLRALGHQGLALSHYAFDRAAFSALERMARQRHALQYGAGSVARSPEDEVLALTDWVLSTGCAAHDSQNALRWSLAELLSDPKAGLKDLFIVMQSLRNAFDLLVGHMQQFLLSAVDFDDRDFNVAE